MARRLLIIHRQVPSGSGPDYDRAWMQLREAAAGVPCHAWRYRSTRSGDSFVEFLEYAAAGDPRGNLEVSEALRALERVAAGEIEEWLDASNVEVTSDRS
jgi:hypothetical protein